MQDLYVFLEVLEYSVSKDGIILWLTVAIVSGILSIRGTSIIKIVIFIYFCLWYTFFNDGDCYK